MLEQHGDIRIQIIQRNVTVEGNAKTQKRWFICTSTPSRPERDSQHKASFATVIQEAWNQFHQQAGEEDKLESSTTTMTTTREQPQQNTPRPQPEETPLATRTSTATPTLPVDSPQVLKDNSDLMEFFGSITSAEYLHKDLFLPSVSSVGLRSKLKSFGMMLAANDHHKTHTSFHDAPETCADKDITTVEPDPCLTKRFGIPMSVPAMSEAAQAIANLSESVPEMSQLPKHGGSKGAGKRIVTMVPSVDKKRLHHNAKQWMQGIIDNATIDNEITSCDIIQVLIRVLHAFDPIAAEDTAESLSSDGDAESSRSKCKLDPQLQQAMMFSAGLNLTQMRTIKSYLCFSNLDMLQPEYVMNALQVQDFVKPTALEFRDGKTRKRTAWQIPINEMLEWNVNKALEAKSFSFNDLTKAHVILVGDHGQGAFRMMATLLLTTRDRRQPRNSTENPCLGSKLALEVDGLCGCVQCQKDAHQVLKETLATPINSSLECIKNQKEVTMCQDADGSVKMCWGKPTAEKVVLATAPVELFMTGDLAFYATALGKEHMAPHWCWRCMSTKKEWSPDNKDDFDPHPLGEPWTIEKLQSRFAQLESGELDASKPEQQRGVTQLPLFPAIPVSNILVPPLHNNELFINHPIKQLLLWINHRIEQTPLNLVNARTKHVDLALERESAKSNLEAAELSKAFRMAERKALRPKKRKGECHFKDNDHRLDCEANETILAQVQARIKECRKQVSSLSAKLKEAAKDVKAIEKNRKALSQVVRQRVEHCCKKFTRQSDLLAMAVTLKVIIVGSFSREQMR